ncbi:hypothetical protein I350_02876 [Cryptococcus amylolentus CBS 6273]|uniref:Uncharacterized protein n=1 Tax=Cryptococcus amylolentus CBS 6273 TaxID=1296118 RepID=A0A1E3K8K5_9TREE|nr:hypothetical protein I350_02876 [Cryptococcus amylolentus CBS 6273]
MASLRPVGYVLLRRLLAHQVRPPIHPLPLRRANSTSSASPRIGVKLYPEPPSAEEEQPLPDGADSSSSSLVLRPYQEHAISSCLSALERGLRRIGVSSPTGSGKTTMFMSLIPQVPFYRSKGKGKARVEDGEGKRKQTLIVVSSVELAEQAEAAAKRLLGPGWTVEVEQARRSATGLADVTVATYQTLNKTERLSKFNPANFKLVIVDEAHHAAAHSYLKLLHYFNQDVTLPSTVEPHTSLTHGNKTPIIGFSATFSRNDQMALSAAFEEIVFHREISAMLKDGWLAPAKMTTVKANLQLDDVELNQQGDFKSSSLARKVDTPEINDLLLATYLTRARERRSTLIFCVDLTHVDNVTQRFRDAGIDARSVSSNSRADIRKATVAGFGAGEFPILVNCEVLTEGTDIPEIDCVILARPTKSKNLLVQMVGRGLRLSPETGKSDCYIIDVIDGVSKTNGLVVTPNLLGLSPEDVDVEDKREKRHTKTEDAPLGFKVERPQERSKRGVKDFKISYVDINDPFKLGSDTREVLQKVTQNAWVPCGKNRYVLELLGASTLLAVTPDPDQRFPFCITYKQPMPVELIVPGKKNSPWLPPRKIGFGIDLEQALQVGDKYAEKIMGRERSLGLSRYAAWRQKPVSAKALKMFLSLSKQDESSNAEMVQINGREVSASSLTAGQVSSWLCAAKNGAKSARGAIDKAEDKKKTKASAKAEKERLHRERNLALPPSL